MANGVECEINMEHLPRIMHYLWDCGRGRFLSRSPVWQERGRKSLSVWARYK